MKSAQLPFNPLLFLEQEYREYGAESSHCLLLAASFALEGDAVPGKTQKSRHCELLPSTRVQLQLSLATGNVQRRGWALSVPILSLVSRGENTFPVFLLLFSSTHHSGLHLT